MRKVYQAKIEYIEQLDGYIVLVLIDDKWSRCGVGEDLIKIWDFREDVEAYIEENSNLKLVEEERI